MYVLWQGFLSDPSARGAHIHTRQDSSQDTEASVDCQLINLNTMQVEHRDRTPMEDSLTTYGIMTPERIEYVVYK